MAATGTPTPNIGLRCPVGTDPASVDDINYNSGVIDTKLGAVGSTSVQAQIDALNDNKAKKPIVIEFTGTTTSSGALLIPTVIANGTFLSAWGKSGSAYFIYRRDPSYFMVRDTTLNVVSETEVTINVAYIPA